MTFTQSSVTRLVLMAHGSRDPRWQAPFVDLLNRARQQLGESAVDLAYMEMCAPSLLDIAEPAYQQGVRQIKVLPLFMSAGGHVSKDLPMLAEQVMMAFDGLEVEILPPVGEHDTVIAAFLSVITQSVQNTSPTP